MIFILRTSYINKQNNALNFIQTEENNVVIYSDRHDLRNVIKLYLMLLTEIYDVFFFFYLNDNW